MTLPRRAAIGLFKGRRLAVAETMRNLARKPRRGLDLLKMTANAGPRPADRPLRAASIANPRHAGASPYARMNAVLGTRVQEGPPGRHDAG